jgi:hypothetical protein
MQSKPLGGIMKGYNTIDELMEEENKRREALKMDLLFNCFMTGTQVRGEIKDSNATPAIGYKKKGKYYLYSY